MTPAGVVAASSSLDPNSSWGRGNHRSPITHQGLLGHRELAHRGVVAGRLLEGRLQGVQRPLARLDGGAGEAGTSTPSSAPPSHSPALPPSLSLPPEVRLSEHPHPGSRPKFPTLRPGPPRTRTGKPPPPARPHPADATAHGPQRRPRPGCPAAVVHLQGEPGGPQQLRVRRLPGLSVGCLAGRGGIGAQEQPQQRQQRQPGCHGEGEAGGPDAPTDRRADQLTGRSCPRTEGQASLPLLPGRRGGGQWTRARCACALSYLREARGPSRLSRRVFAKAGGGGEEGGGGGKRGLLGTLQPRSNSVGLWTRGWRGSLGIILLGLGDV